MSPVRLMICPPLAGITTTSHWVPRATIFAPLPSAFIVQTDGVTVKVILEPGETAVRGAVHVNGQAELLEVVAALDAPGSFPGRLDRREQKRDQNPDNGDHHQHFHQGKPFSCCPGHRFDPHRRGLPSRSWTAANTSSSVAACHRVTDLS